MDTDKSGKGQIQFLCDILPLSSQRTEVKGFSVGGSLGRLRASEDGCLASLAFEPNLMVRRLSIRHIVSLLHGAGADFAWSAFESSSIFIGNHAMRELPPVWRQHTYL
jgi:hypothetical protein